MRRLLRRSLLPVLLVVLLPLAPASGRSVTAGAADVAGAADAGIQRVADDTRTFFWANAQQAYGSGAANAVPRMGALTALIRRLHVSAGSLAELEQSQVRRFRLDMRGRYGIVPGSRQGLTNAVFYDTSAYRLAWVSHFGSYFFFGQHVSQPVAALQDLQSGATVAVIAVHNPADLYGRSNLRWRKRAIAAELAEVARLQRAGLPVILAGDFNNKGPVRRRIVARGGLMSAVPCPLSSDSAVGIDQMFASGLRLSGYHPMWGRHISMITNHEVVYTARYQLAAPPSPAA